jgi:hypothetical protein
VATSRPSAAVAHFRAIADGFLAEKFRLFPQQGSALGLAEFHAELGSNDAATHRHYVELLASTITAIEALPDSAFTGDDWLDRRGFLAFLRIEFQDHGPLATWRRNPQTHCDAAFDSILLLLLRHAGRLGDIRAAIESRLAKLPRFLEEGAACLRAPVPLWVKLTRQTCSGAPAFFRDVAAQLAPHSPRPARLRQLCERATAAFARYSAAVARKAPGPAGGYSLGRDAFEHRLRELTGLPYSLRETRAIGEALVAQLGEELAVEARKFGGGTSAAIIRDAAARWRPTAPTLLEEYRQRTAAVRARFKRAGMCTFPRGERCEVIPVPDFLRHHFPTAAYLPAPPFAEDQTGFFWVNDLSALHRDPARRAAEVAQHFGVDMTCAHEAYPGHHLQFVIQNRHPSRLRRLMQHAIGYEGWTLWCEKLAVDLGINERPDARLVQLHDALWRAHRIVIDCGLHDGTLTHASAARRLQQALGFTAARARAEINWYTTFPTVPLSYLLGRLENERLHAQLCGREGWTLQRFNDWLLSHGALPQRWIWEARLHAGKMNRGDAEARR